MKKDGGTTGYGFGAFQGVFTPSILTIIGVVMYLRFGWMLGNVGLTTALAIVTIGSTITFLTGLSISALATNMRMRGGGAYFMLSRSLGLEAGAALGIPLALSQAISVSFYISGFAEALVNSGLPVVSGWDFRTVGLITLAVLAVISTISADLALKSQYVIMAAIALSLVSFFAGGAPEGLVAPVAAPEPIGFWPVFAVFFPAVTGILSGVGMSGDLKDPGKAIPKGTIAAVLVGYAVYMSVPLALHAMVPDARVLCTDTMILQKCARWPMLILVGVWAATLSSAVGSFLCAPRVLQALSRDRLLPGIFGRGFGKADDPRLGAVFCFGIAAAGIALGDINALAPILTLFNLSTYGLLNLSAAFEEVMANPSWRPTFRVRAFFSFAGCAGCVVAMFMISPGWTFVALGCEAFIYWLVKRRALRTRWGDMRTGLLMACVRFVFHRLARRPQTERNWRPNLLAFTSLTTLDRPFLELVREISGGRSLVTLAAVLPKEAGSTADLADFLKRQVEKLDLDASLRLLPAESSWAGMQEMVRTYGFGPIVPNTVVLGEPGESGRLPFSAFVQELRRLKRNLLVVGVPTPAREEGHDVPVRRFIDVWWRGGSSNGGLMLAIAFLLRRSDLWRTYRLRVNMIVRRRTPEQARGALAAFMRDVRVEAETRIIDLGDRSFAEVIRDNSSDAALTFVGLRAPDPDEAPTAYGDYFSVLADHLRGVPRPLYVLASEDVDFRRIFT